MPGVVAGGAGTFLPAELLRVPRSRSPRWSRSALHGTAGWARRGLRGSDVHTSRSRPPGSQVGLGFARPMSPAATDTRCPRRGTTQEMEDPTLQKGLRVDSGAVDMTRAGYPPLPLPDGEQDRLRSRSSLDEPSRREYRAGVSRADLTYFAGSVRPSRWTFAADRVAPRATSVRPSTRNRMTCTESLPARPNERTRADGRCTTAARSGPPK